MLYSQCTKFIKSTRLKHGEKFEETCWKLPLKYKQCQMSNVRPQPVVYGVVVDFIFAQHALIHPTVRQTYFIEQKSER